MSSTNHKVARSKPLSGLLVVAVEQAVAAPLCTARLADAGARVIKIERPGGDFARGYDDAAGGDSSYFAWTNHGKESIALDLGNPEDSALVHRMLARADVFVQNLAPGALARKGLGQAEMRDQYPRLVTAEISGYGTDDALGGRKGYDLLVQAESGLVAVSGAPEAPGRIGVSLCDIGAAITTQSGILEALIARSLTGEGSHVSVSLFDIAAEWMSVPWIHEQYGAGAPEPVGLRHPSIAPYGAFRDAAGRDTLISIQNEAEFERLCTQVLGLPDVPRDARFANNTERVRHRDALDALVADAFAQQQTADLRLSLDQASIAYGAVNSVADLASHPALSTRSVRNTSGVTLSLPAHPARCDEDIREVPGLDQHGAAIREEFTP